MINICIAYPNYILLNELVGNYNGNDFKIFLETKIIPKLNSDIGFNNFNFQKDNASIHNCQQVKNFLSDKRI